MALDLYTEYRQQWADAGQGKITPVPTHIDLELSSACNFRCPMCPQAEKEVAFKKDFMDTDRAVGLLWEAKQLGVRSVKLNWRGESTLHPDFQWIVRAAKKLKFDDLMLNTNGSWDYNNTDLHESVRSFDTLIFSIDTFDPEKAKKLRPGVPLKTVLFNFMEIALNRHKFGTPSRLKINFTLQKENADEVDKVKRCAETYHADLSIRPVFPRNPPKVGEYFDETKVHVMGRKNCGFPFQRLVVAHDGKVAPCCVPWSNNLWVGDVTKQSLRDIWEGEDLRRIREDAMKAAYSHPTCVNCTSWSSYEVIHGNG